MNSAPPPRKAAARSKPPGTLRQRAEAAVRTTRTQIARMPAQEIQRLIHELQVHQVELEMQNEELRRAQSELTDSCERFSELYDHAPAGYLTLNAKGVVLAANLAAARMLGIPRAELIGTPLTRFIARESQDAYYLHRQELLSGAKVRTCELHFRSSGGTKRLVHLDCNCFIDAVSNETRCRAILIDLSERERAQRELAAAQAASELANEKLRQTNETLECRVAERTAQLRALTVELARTEERERQRMAETLHEGLLQLLTGALISLAALRKQSGNEAAHLKDAEACLDEAINVGRTLTHELSPPALHTLGLVATLEWLGQHLRRQYDLSVEISAPPGFEVGEKEARVTLFRAAHELLFNVVKHAKVQRAHVSLRCARGGGVRLVVSDVGAGFDVQAVRVGEGASGGFGLFSLRERIESLGGRIHVRSAPGRGSRVTISLPQPLRSAPAALAAGSAQRAKATRRMNRSRKT